MRRCYEKTKRQYVMSSSEIFITKRDGKRELFSLDKNTRYPPMRNRLDTADPSLCCIAVQEVGVVFQKLLKKVDFIPEKV